MTQRQPTEPVPCWGGLDSIPLETPEQTRAWAMAEAWREPIAAKPVPYSEPYDCGTGL